MSRAPNIEQQKAIFKKDGVLLSAGAGSGKTFVIIEHIVYLISEFNLNPIDVNFNEELISRMSKIVLMTFTKKASGEMLVRLINRVESKVLENEETAIFWSEVLKNINVIQISTIHGFCHKLISAGFWPSLPSKIDLHSSFIQKNKIKNLCTVWVERNKDNLSDLFLSHLTDLYKAMDDIFTTPELRILWEKGQVKRTLAEEIDEFFEGVIELCNYGTLFSNSFVASRDADKIKKQGFLLLSKYEDLYNTEGKINFKNYKKYYSMFEDFSSFPRETKDMSTEESALRSELKILYDYLKKIKTDLMGLGDNYEVFLDWENKLFELFNFISSSYLTESGFSFSDLEYYVYRGLEDKIICQKIAERFSYFIVDEFQDTSFVQFEIVKRCALEKTERMFCVGDKKQAIYGFRGGELQVFEDCSKLLGPAANLFLKANYRSKSNVINFNNKFFDDVFPKGTEYENRDSHSVTMEYQTTPNLEKVGDVVQYNCPISAEDEKNVDLDIVEAQSILQIIEDQLGNDEIKSIAILYRKLKPSHFLIDLLREKKINFSAQIKIKIDDDPVVNLYVHFLHYLLNAEDLKKKDNSKFFIESIFLILGFEKDIESHLKQFISNVPLLGINISFWLALTELGVSNSLFKENALLIDEIAKIGNNDPLLILKILNDQDTDYSFEMITGTNKKIYILSTHASKGLEYDSVILGGIHKNGRYEGLKKKVGNFPKSFKWKKSFDQKNYFKSLGYYFEAELTAAKDFSESKRLFYVACTRAIKKLSFVNISVNGKEKSFNGNSWINAIRLFRNDFLQIQNLELNLQQVKNQNLSYMQKDSLGILSQRENKHLGIISELSVTRLASLANCPFKFYLKNICKLEPSSILLNTLDTDELEFYSSKERGSDLHFILSRLLKKELELSKVKTDYKDIASWVLEEVQKVSVDKIISEQEIKFSFFGQMISAIPDLFLINSNKIEVWDFKTGMREIENEESYIFQLKAYASGLFKVYGFNQDCDVVLKLIYLDQKEIVSNCLKLNEINEYLFNVWKKTEKLDQINREHCGYCEYSSMCKFSSHIASL